MATYKLTQLQYSQDRKGPFQLYVFGRDGRSYTVRTWFAKPVTFPDEEIPIAEARELATAAISHGQEVRVCDAGDELVFHSAGGKTIYGDRFWEEIA
jgi:hypothetical protein